MQALRWILRGVGVLAIVLVLVAVGARYSDGPLGPLAGGPLVAGERVRGLVDWAFVEDVDTIELQLVKPPRSRTVRVVLHDGSAYIPCRLPGFRLWKQWPHEALEDGRAVLRIDGRRYHGRLVKVENPSLHGTLAGMVAAKYGVASDFDADTLWLFRFES
jgi:hypothetical protein